MVPQMVILLAILRTIITFLTHTEHFKIIIFLIYQREYLLNILAGKRVTMNIRTVEQKSLDSTIKSIKLFDFFLILTSETKG